MDSWKRLTNAEGAGKGRLEKIIAHGHRKECDEGQEMQAKDGKVGDICNSVIN